MLPKTIHYCWFGEAPLPKSAQKCIASWKKFFPDYEIKQWDESNYDVDKIPYISEAYKAKKYAFVSDYARFDILYHFGGIYFDTDVEVIRPFDDILDNSPNFMGCEIKKITLAKNNPAYQLIDGVLFTADGKTLVYYPCHRPGDTYYVPEGTEKLMSGSFYWVKYLRNLYIPEGVKSIGDYVVYVCYSVSMVQLPASLEEIGSSSLEGQTNDFVVSVPAGSFAETWCRTHWVKTETR